MTAQFVWFHRLPEILTILWGMGAVHWVSQVVEGLFRVRERYAGELMVGLDGLWVGNIVAVSQCALCPQEISPNLKAFFFSWCRNEAGANLFWNRDV